MQSRANKNDVHLGEVDDINHNQVFIWDEYLHFNDLTLTAISKRITVSGPAVTTSWTSELVKKRKSFSSEIFTLVALVPYPNMDDTSVIFPLLGFSYLKKKSSSFAYRFLFYTGIKQRRSCTSVAMQWLVFFWQNAI